MNIRDLLDKYGVAYREGGSHKNVRDGWIAINCPWCNDPGSDHFHMGVNPESVACTCWQCGSHSLYSVLLSFNAVTPKEAYKAAKLVLPEKHVYNTPSSRGVFTLPDGLEPMGSAHRTYLRDRGFDPEELERVWELQGIGLTSKLSWRLYIPVLLRGRPVTWTTRALGSGPKYVNAKPEHERYPIKELLYGTDYTAHSAVITEGPADVWRGGPGFVATFGVKTTTAQLRWMAALGTRAICFDNEPAARQRAKTLVDVLKLYPGRTFNIELDSSDLGEATTQEVKQIRHVIFSE